MPRATTAAWEVMPPWQSEYPGIHACLQCPSGEVSRRTRTTGSPVSSIIFTASAAEKATRTQAAPGEAGRASRWV